MDATDSFIRHTLTARWQPDWPPGIGPALSAPAPLWSRHTFPFHATASVFVLDSTLSQILLIHHRRLNRWLQPGGHLDPGETPAEAARRELREETGIDLPSLSQNRDAPPVSIDIHAIPASPAKAEPAHWHIDFRYLCRHNGPVSPDPTETLGFTWRPLIDAEVIDPAARAAIMAMHKIEKGRESP